MTSESLPHSRMLRQLPIDAPSRNKSLSPKSADFRNTCNLWQLSHDPPCTYKTPKIVPAACAEIRRSRRAVAADNVNLTVRPPQFRADIVAWSRGSCSQSAYASKGNRHPHARGRVVELARCCPCAASRRRWLLRQVKFCGRGRGARAPLVEERYRATSPHPGYGYPRARSFSREASCP
jgi:hypothetical protein